MGKVIDLAAHRDDDVNELDVAEGVTDAGMVADVDVMEQIVMANARRIAIELLRRGAAGIVLHQARGLCSLQVVEG